MTFFQRISSSAATFRHSSNGLVVDSLEKIQLCTCRPVASDSANWMKRGRQVRSRWTQMIPWRRLVSHYVLMTASHFCWFQYVVNVTPNLPNVFEDTGLIQYLQIPITDHWSQNLASFFPTAISFIGERVFFVAESCGIRRTDRASFNQSGGLNWRSGRQRSICGWSLHCGDTKRHNSELAARPRRRRKNKRWGSRKRNLWIGA